MLFVGLLAHMLHDLVDRDFFAVALFIDRSNLRGTQRLHFSAVEGLKGVFSAGQVGQQLVQNKS